MTNTDDHSALEAAGREYAQLLKDLATCLFGEVALADHPEPTDMELQTRSNCIAAAAVLIGQLEIKGWTWQRSERGAQDVDGLPKP